MSSLVWVELDREAPDHNAKELIRGAKQGVKLCAVVKSNAYGHGVGQMAGLLPSVHWFAVNSLEEGLQLRRLGVERPVLVLGHVPIARLGEARDSGLRLTVFNRDTIVAIEALPGKKEPVRVHLEIETGTARQGVLPEKVEGFVKQIRGKDGLVLEGVSTHFANIEDTLNHEYAERQLTLFSEVLEKIRGLGIDPPVVHTACSAASILFPKTHFTMLRTGIGLYGLWPSKETYLSARMGSLRIPELKPVLTWKAKIVQIKTLPAGNFVGYGCTYKTTRRTKLAVLPVGYADGYDRAFGNRAHVLVHGKRAPVIGRVCMNHCMIDVTDIPKTALEDEVVLLGKSEDESIVVEKLAEWAGTINYEVVSRISPLLERKVV
ncbi:MAG TPA: alanine racemase [Spirochaetota bacterium]|nr:alanine racemase [Spirochaetota bacterium]